jgi:hypothetical protein
MLDITLVNAIKKNPRTGLGSLFLYLGIMLGITCVIYLLGLEPDFLHFNNFNVKAAGLISVACLLEGVALLYSLRAASIVSIILIIAGTNYFIPQNHCPADPRLPNHVTITKPKNGDNIGHKLIVKGTLSRNDLSHVWVLLHPKLWFQGQWWPQNKPTIHADGTWEALAFVGVPQDIGMEFEIAVAVFGVEENRWIEEYHKKAAKDGSWRPIDFPETTSNICILTVRKTSH